MAHIKVIGAGVVGKATGFGLLHHNNDVTFVDVNPKTIDNLRGDGYSAITPEELSLSDTDAVFLAVTALTGENGIDLTHLLTATKNLGDKLAEGYTGFPVIVYRCTMPPGTMRSLLIPLLEERSGKKAGQNFGVAYNPEYLREVSSNEDFLKPTIITMSTLDEHDQSHQVLQGILSSFGVSMEWLPFEAAELQKYVNNVFNAIKISAFNWFREIGNKVGLKQADIDRAFSISTISAEALYNPVYGTRNFGPYGGVCLPKDVKALRHYAAQLNMDTSLLDSVEQINETVKEG